MSKIEESALAMMAEMGSDMNFMECSCNGKAMSRNLALEWGDYRIRCNCIAPGPIKD